MKQIIRITAILLAVITVIPLCVSCGSVQFNAAAEVTTARKKRYTETTTKAKTEKKEPAIPSETELPESAPKEAEETIKGEFELTTAKPKYDDYSIIANGTTCITGTTENNAVLTVSGNTFETFTTTAQDKRFFISINLKKDETDTVSIVAQAKGKNPSRALTVDIEYERGGVEVFVGKGSQLHYPQTKADYRGNDLFNESQLRAINRGIDKRLENARKYGKETTKLIYLIAPNCLTAYPETAPDDLAAEKVSVNSKLKQFAELIKSRGDNDVFIVELEQVMLDNKKEGKLYYQTDTHWNTLGSYFGYYELMNIIYKDTGNELTKPYELDSFNIWKDLGNGGDLVNFLGVSPSAVTENITHCSLDLKRSAEITNEADGSVRSRVQNAALPTAVVMRDSFGAALIDHTSEQFKEILYTPWNCGLTGVYEYMKTVKPDYLIQVMVERSLSAMLGG
ncbi:MAG: hypothetical protein PHZ09_02805 [Eubacteriales bacterium]|nr:hypothetical protein [Eubacteriales bacterium]